MHSYTPLSSSGQWSDLSGMIPIKIKTGDCLQGSAEDAEEGTPVIMNSVADSPQISSS